MCLGSSVVEHPAVNRQVVGSNPTLSAIKILHNSICKSILSRVC